MNSVLDEILKEARKAGAGNVHLTVNCPPVMRIGQKIEKMKFPALTATDTLNIILYVMNEAQREEFETRGEAEVAFTAADGGRCRISAYKQGHLAALAVRILKEQIPSLTELGAMEQAGEFCKKRQGFVVVTGGSGCGKTTTIAALIREINESEQRMILTIERPVEYLHENKNSVVIQREIGTDAESAAAALKAAVREDMDVIVVSEVEDAQTLNALLTAVETGHLVFAELPAADIAGAVEELTALYPESERALLKARLSRVPFAVVAQRFAIEEEGSRTTAQFKVLKNKLWDQAL